jgi:oxygen-independent coproporphyrinogen III oxidase
VAERPPTLCLYVHIPFCEAKCTYCHFAIDPRRPDEARQERYLRALLAEMDGAAEGAADTVYFGGGTPSLLSPRAFGRLLEAARRHFALAADAEVTIEANPRDLDGPGYRDLRALGATRLSLGAQSFDDSALVEMGRLHSAADVEAAVVLAREAGFRSISLDLILGWPRETAARFERSLRALEVLRPEHVSLYLLEVEGKTLLAHAARRGGLSLPDDDLVADLYATAVAALADLGLERYEISNFARPGFESRHNRKYWDDAPFLGFGMSAHSYREGRRFWNHDTYGRYCRAIEEEGAGGAQAGQRLLTPREHLGEALFTGLRRREGIGLEAFAARFGRDPLREYAEDLKDPIAAGLLEVSAGRLRLTERGVLLSNEVFRAFL